MTQELMLNVIGTLIALISANSEYFDSETITNDNDLRH